MSLNELGDGGKYEIWINEKKHTFMDKISDIIQVCDPTTYSSNMDMY